MSMKFPVVYLFFLSANVLLCATSVPYDDLQGPDGQDLEPGYIGLVQHDVERRLEAWEDQGLPVPTHIHMLGQTRRDETSTGRSKSVPSLRRKTYGGMSNAEDGLITPLSQGYGTHFSYVYVGTPPQRQSVIVDTGSHYTAFPCSGCAQCGQHTDAYWDLKNSSSAKISKCGKDPCSFGQSYSEGSSWKAFKVVDKFWVGGVDVRQLDGSGKAIDFMFGCQTSETGLFRTQLADGIMGMAMATDTLPYQLVEQRAAASNVFAMCFRVGGGIMTIGGVDQRIHSRPQVFYAGIRSQEGWYTVTLIDVMLVNQESKQKMSLGVDKSKYNSGKGPIVDSGTTDTYLPMAIATQFKSLFKQLSGVTFSNANIPLTVDQLARMPDVVFVLQGYDGNPFEVVMPWTSYIDKVGQGKFAFRIYLTEGSGAVLGANFMNGYNVIFDRDQQRVGFAKSDCKYDDFVIKKTLPPVVAPTPAPTKVGATHAPTTAEQKAKDSKKKRSGSPSEDPCATKASTQCTAKCRKEAGAAYMQSGEQTILEPCDSDKHTLDTPSSSVKACNQPCVGSAMVRGKPECPEKAWGACQHQCVQSRQFPSSEELSRGVCHYVTQTRPCYSGECPLNDGDMLVFIDMRVSVSPQDWTYVHTEVFFGALTNIFGLKAGSIELLNDASTEYTRGAKLHFQIRLKAKDFKDTAALTKAAQAIPRKAWMASFGETLVRAIEAESQYQERIDFSRYGSLSGKDVEILNAAALPVGDVREPVEIPNEGGTVIINHIQETLKNREDYLLLGVAIASLSCMLCMACFYIRLHRQNEQLSKEKIESTTLMRVYNRFQSWRDGQPRSTIDSRGRYSELEMLDAISEHAQSNPLQDAQLDDNDMNG